MPSQKMADRSAAGMMFGDATASGGHRSWSMSRVSVLAGAALLVAALGLLGRLLSYPLEHDEQIHVAAAVLLGEYDLYGDLGYNHLPNLPWLLNGVFRLTGTEHYLLAGRLCIVASWVGVWAALLLIARHQAQSATIAVLAMLLMVTNTLLLGQAGMIVSNNLIPIPFALFGFYFFLRGGEGPAPKPGYFALAGLLLSCAVGFKANYLFLIPPFAVAALFVPRGSSLGRRLAGTVLPLLAGGLIGGLPTLIYLFGDPESFFAHTLRYFTGPHAQYWAALDAPKVMSTAQKVQLAEQVWFLGSTLLAICAVGYLALLRLFTSARGRGASDLLSWPILLVSSLAALGVLVSFVPTPSFPQYFVPPLAFLAVLVILLYGRLDSAQRAAATPLLVVIGVLALMIGATRLLAGIPALVSPNKWTGFQVHQLGGRIASLVESSGAKGRVATLAPIHALEGGLATYPEFAAGPFLYRVADLMAPADRRYFRMTSEARLPAFLDADPPAAIMVGFEDKLDHGFIAYALSRGYVEAPLEGASTKDGRLRLYVRRDGPGTVGAR